MLVSFFDDGTFVTGIDYGFVKGTPEVEAVPATEDSPEIPYQPAVPDRGRISCVGVYEVDFDNRTQTVSLVKGEVIVEDIS